MSGVDTYIIAKDHDQCHKHTNSQIIPHDIGPLQMTELRNVKIYSAYNRPCELHKLQIHLGKIKFQELTVITW